MVEREPLPELRDVPHLVLEVESGQRAIFSFRGTKGYIQQCDLGLCMALAFPRRNEGINWAHRVSLLLASYEKTLDFGLQHEGDHWFLWRRHNMPTLSSDDCKSALDELLSVMRFLYGRSAKSGTTPAQNSLHKASIGRFV